MKLSVREVAALLKVTPDKVYDWIEQEHLPAREIGGQYRFNRAELLEWATTRQVSISSEIFNGEGREAGALPVLSEALAAGGIFHGVGGANREAVLRAVVETLPFPGEVDRELLLDVLLAREALGSTGVGDGIAIPHVRNPVIVHVSQAMIGLCFLSQPIEFGALDGKPVHALFTLISPTVRIHLHLLSRLAFALRDDGFKSAVARQAPQEEIMKAARLAERGLVQKGIVKDKETQR